MKARILRWLKCDDPTIIEDLRARYPSVLVEQASSILMGVINMMIIGTVSSAALAGVGQINTLNQALFYFFNNFSLGGTVLVSQYVGAKNYKDAGKSAWQALMIGLLFSTLVMALMSTFRVGVLTALFGKVEQDVMEYSLNYFRYTVLATPLWFIYYQCAGIMRGIGDTKTPMRISLIMNVTNALMSCLLVLVFKLESIGVGLALLCALVVGSSLSLFAVFRGSFMLCLKRFKSIKPDFEKLRSILSIGTTAGCESLLLNGGKIIVQTFLAGMGTANISAYQVSVQVLNIWQLPMNAMSTLSVPLIGHRAGTGDKQRTSDALGFINRLGVFIGACIMVGMCVLSYPTCMLFTREREVLLIAWQLTYIYAFSMMLWSPAWVIPACFRGAKHVRFSLIVGVFSMWICRVGGSYVLGILLGLGVYGVTFSSSLDWAVRSLSFVSHYRKGNWKRNIKYVGNEHKTNDLEAK